MIIELFLSWFSSFLTKDNKHLIILCLIRSSCVLIISSKYDWAIVDMELVQSLWAKLFVGVGKGDDSSQDSTNCDLEHISQSAKLVCTSSFLLCPLSCCVLCSPVVSMFLRLCDHMRILAWRTRFWISGGTEASCVLVMWQYDQHCSFASFLSSCLGSNQ